MLCCSNTQSESGNLARLLCKKKLKPFIEIPAVWGVGNIQADNFLPVLFSIARPAVCHLFINILARVCVSVATVDMSKLVAAIDTF